MVASKSEAIAQKPRNEVEAKAGYVPPEPVRLNRAEMRAMGRRRKFTGIGGRSAWIAKRKP
jgi:hypothetical protein